tara:strand:- start:474 stop:1328 length:855 start_codon:yes stop_codon:yes gene_type:complete
MTEQEAFLQSKTEITEQTRKNYTSQYNKWFKALGKNIQDATQEEILSQVKLFTKNPSSEWTFLNVPFMVLRQFNKSINLIEERRNELKLERICHTETYKKEKSKALPSKKIIVDFTKKLFENKQYFKFIVNYLLITYGVRNKDIDVFITDATNKGLTDRNLLYVKKNEIEWVINDYKTAGTYGVKKIIIKSKPIMEAVKGLQINSWLFGGNTHIAPTSLSRIISRNTFNELTEGDYFKILIRDANKSSNTSKLLKLYSDSRGTSINNIMEYYDVTDDCDIPDEI